LASENRLSEGDTLSVPHGVENDPSAFDRMAPDNQVVAPRRPPQFANRNLQVLLHGARVVLKQYNSQFTSNLAYREGRVVFWRPQFCHKVVKASPV
jgi:hypothetical protein